MGPDIDRIFKRLEQKIIGREVACAAIKQLVGLHARSIAGFNTADLHSKIDDLFERQRAAVTLPPSFIHALKSIIAGHLAEARREAAEAARILLISD